MASFRQGLFLLATLVGWCALSSLAPGAGSLVYADHEPAAQLVMLEASTPITGATPAASSGCGGGAQSEPIVSVPRSDHDGPSCSEKSCDSKACPCLEATILPDGANPIIGNSDRLALPTHSALTSRAVGTPDRPPRV